MTAATPIEIIIADDHSLFLKSLKLVINETSDFKLVGEAANGRELVELAIKFKPDIIVTDIKMPVMNGIEAAKQIMKELPATKIIALSIRLLFSKYLHHLQKSLRFLKEVLLCPNGINLLIGFLKILTL